MLLYNYKVGGRAGEIVETYKVDYLGKVCTLFRFLGVSLTLLGKVLFLGFI